MLLRARIRTAVQIGAVAAVILIATLPADEASRIGSLADAAMEGGERPTTARLSGFPWSPAPQQSRSPEVMRPLPVLSAAAQILRRGGHDRGEAVALLMMGDRTAAVRALESLTAVNPHSANLWSDLAAARFEQAAAAGDDALFGPALAAADEALRLEPSLGAAAFNRGLALERLGLRKAAADAFSRVAIREAGTKWGDEARQRHDALNDESEAEAWGREKAGLENGVDVLAIVRRFPQQARTTAEGDYLARWAEALTEGRSADAERWLGVCRDIGRALVTVNGERLLFETVSGIDAANDPRPLARAQLTYREARILYSTEQRRVQDALPLFREAGEQFASSASPMRHVAHYYLANALFDARQYEESRALLRVIAREIPSRYAALQAQLLWLDATASAHAGEPQRALQKSREAAERFTALGEHENAARMHLAVALNLRALGRTAEAHTARARAFEAVSRAGKSSLLLSALNAAARDEVRDRRWAVAASLFALLNDVAARSPRIAFDACLWGAVARARSRGEVLDLAEARAALSAARDASLRADMEDELRFVDAVEIAPPAAAVRLLTECIDYRRAQPRHPELVRAYTERARLLRTLGDRNASESDWRQALAITEERRGTIERDDLRDTFFGTTARIPTELADLLASEGRLDEAFSVVADARDHAFREHDTDGASVATPLRARPGVVILQIATLPSGALLSVIGERGMHHVRTDTRAEDIREWTERLTGAIERSDAGETTAAGRALYELLLAPVASTLNSSRLLIIVPDEVSAAIPYAALRDARGRFLVERTAFAVSPSARLATSRDASRLLLRLSSEKALIIADPAFDAASYPRLARLPAARRDAETLLRFLPHAEALRGSEATRERTLAGVKDATALHIAAHAITNPLDAWRSFLVLAPDGGNDGSLYLQDIANRDLRNLDLVVLAGCRTAVRAGGSGDVRSLATAFVAAGAHDVVASLWDVDDAPVAALTEEYFRSLAASGDPVAALRVAQLSLLHSSDPNLSSPRTWAALEVVTR